MSEEKFQVIIIGAGLAGSSAAYRLAKAGMEVLVVERGSEPGVKNMTGGRLYTYALEELMPGEWQDTAPLEREITREMIMMMTEDNTMSIDSLFPSVDKESYSVLRGKFDSWLAGKAEEEGAIIIPGTTVEELIIRDGKVCGIKTGEEELEADLVISAEGMNALTAERAGLINPPKPEDVAVALKYVYQLTEEKVSDRFNTEDNTKGAAMLMAGECTKRVPGGGFLYSNKDSISVGLVLDTASWKKAKIHLVDFAEEFRAHPAIARYLQGGELIEYSAHMIPEGGINALPQLYSDGFMLTGDAAGLVVNRGFTVRGMDYAILSGIAAAETAIEAIENENYSKKFLSKYEDKLNKVVLADLKTFKTSHKYIAETEHMFDTYPDLATGLMNNLYRVDGKPAKVVKDVMKESIKGKVPYVSVLKDVMKVVKSL